MKYNQQIQKELYFVIIYRIQNSLFGNNRLKWERLLHIESNGERIVLLILLIQIVSRCIDKIDCQNSKKIKKPFSEYKLVTTSNRKHFTADPHFTTDSSV